MGLAPAAADWSSIKNNTNITNSMDKQSKALLVKYTVSWSGLSRHELGMKQGEERGAIGTMARQGGEEERFQTARFLKAYAKVLLFA